MIYDTHVHSCFSSDSDAKPRELIEAANKMNMNVIFTEHYDADFVENDSDFRVNADEYITNCEVYKTKGALLGVEIGLTAESRVRNEAFAGAYPFDYVIGSVHMADMVDIYLDMTRSAQPVLSPAAYYRCVAEMTQDAFYDSLGHIDYPHRYADARKTDFSYAAHMGYYDTILRNIIDRDICIEINTRRLADKEAFLDLLSVYKRYAVLGGKYVTIGSDAHNAAAVGLNFKKAFELAEICSLVPVYFKERKRFIC